jgi:hypothetical protein
MDWITHGAITLEVNFTGHYASVPLKVRARHFKPREEDILINYYSSSGPIPIPPYAAEDIEAMKQDVVLYMQSLLPIYLEAKAPKSAEAVIDIFDIVRKFIIRLSKLSIEDY